ncbi:MAG: hypothetical protein JST31_03560 [Actinobacteria bacterium]|nr:hypothetical protein [Actinomycetota bacterium]
MKHVRGKLTYANVMSTISVFLLLGGASAYAATQLAKNSVGSAQLKKNAVTAAKLKNGAVTGAKVADGSLSGADLAAGSVTGAQLAANSVVSSKVADKSLTGGDIADNTLTGASINESTLGKVPETERLDGRTRTQFLSSSIYKNESAVEAGVDKGEGTFAISEGCNPGDVLLAGGPANIRASSAMLESFSTPGDINSWTVRIQKNGFEDNWSVVVLCVKQ